MTIRKRYLLTGLILITGILLVSSGCGMLLFPFIPKAAETTTTTSSNTGTTFPAGYFTISGTVNSGGLNTTEAVGLVVFKNKADLQSKSVPPVTSEAKVLVSGSFTYSVSTNEAGTYYIVAYYPTQEGNPTWAGGPGISSNMTTTQFIAALLGVDLTAGNPNATVNITLYQLTGP